MKFQSLTTALFLALLSAASSSSAAPTDAKRNVVPNRYIVTLRPEANLAQFSRALKAEVARERPTGDVVSAFGHQVAIGSSFKAVIGTFSPEMLDKLKANGQVARIEPNGIVRAFETTQLNPQNWGLPRMSRRTGKQGNYFFPDKQGAGVDVYVFDTGIFIEHDEFTGGRRGSAPFKAEESWTYLDAAGHGTHVASTIAGTKYGVAKRARVHAVKVLDDNGGGTFEGVIRGMEWVANEIRKTGKTSVCNFSLGATVGGQAPFGAVEQAVASLFEAGCVVVKAAGNEQSDACNATPARAPQGLTVAALAEDGQSLDHGYTNFGRCVQIVAPGSGITAAWNKAGYTHTISGTSMASPHVAGAAALILGQEPGLKPQQVVDRILARASQGVITGDLKGTPNRVVYVRE